MSFFYIVGILAGKFHTLSKPAFIVLFALLQFFFNFGANTTTYVSTRALAFVQKDIPNSLLLFFLVLPR